MTLKLQSVSGLCIQPLTLQYADMETLIPHSLKYSYCCSTIDRLDLTATGVSLSIESLHGRLTAVEPAMKSWWNYRDMALTVTLFSTRGRVRTDSMKCPVIRDYDR
jgi:hypothetical protein